MPLKPAYLAAILTGERPLTTGLWYMASEEQQAAMKQAGVYARMLDEMRREREEAEAEKKRKHEEAKAERKAERRNEPSPDGLCMAWVSARRPRGSPWDTPREAKRCGRTVHPSSGRFCLACYRLKQFHIQPGRAGGGTKTRPFSDKDIPWGKLSKWQHKALKKLPVGLGLKEVIAQLNAADAGNPVEAVTRKTIEKEVRAVRRKAASLAKKRTRRRNKQDISRG